jgi:hypothetical protein
LLKEAGCEWAVSTSQFTVIYGYDLGLQTVVSLVDLLCKCLRLTAMFKCVTDVQRLSVRLYEHDAEARCHVNLIGWRKAFVWGMVAGMVAR